MRPLARGLASSNRRESLGFSAAMREVGFNVRLLSAGPFVTMLDRFAVAPVLIPIALEFRA